MLPARDRVTLLKVYPSKADALANTNGTSYTTGIVYNSAHLDRPFFQKLPGFGECNASMFECELSINVDLKGKWIRVATQAYATTQATSRTTYWLFTGLVDSCKYDSRQATRKLVAYDEMYTLRNTNISSWWNTYWSDKTGSIASDTVLSAMMTAFNVSGTAATTYGNYFSIVAAQQKNNLFSGCSFTQMLSYFGLVKPVSFHFNAVGQLSACVYSTVNKTATALALDSNVDTTNSSFGDEANEEFGSVVINMGSELAYRDGNTEPTFTQQDNPLLAGRSAAGMTTVAQNLLTAAKKMSGLREAEISLIVSTNDIIWCTSPISYNNVVYMPSSVEFSGPQLIDQVFHCTGDLQSEPSYTPAITAENIVDGAIRADKIEAGAITTIKIDPNDPLADYATNTGVAATYETISNASSTYATKVAASSSSQRIYYRSNSNTAPTAPTSYVTSTSTANKTWTLKRMSIVSDDSGYKYIWTCTQTKTVSGTVTNSAVLLDDTITVIDGGNIITGSVTSNQIATGTITVNNMSSDTRNATLNSNIEVGGINLALRTATMPTTGTPRYTASVEGTLSTVAIVDAPIGGLTNAIRVTNGTASATRCGMSGPSAAGLVVGKQYTIGCWIRASAANLVIDVRAAWSSNSYTDIKIFDTPKTTTSWQYIKFEGSTLGGAQATSYVRGLVHVRDLPANGWFEVCGLKVEEGNKATSWSAAPEDIDAANAATYATQSDAAGVSQRIYYRKSSSGAPTAPTTWVTSTSTANATWTTKRMPYDSTYKYLYTCVQTKSVSGTVSNSTVLLDDTTTVIDGGSITTGLVAANRIDVTDLQAFNATIAGWSLSTTQIKKTFTIDGVTYTAYMQAITDNPVATNGAFVISRTENGVTTYPFIARYNGALKSTNADITGKITATSGNIAGWALDTSTISKEVTIDGYVYQVVLNAPPSPTAGNWAIGVRRRATNSQTWSYLSYFNYSGKLYSQNAEITGKITSSEGSIGGWSITSDSIEKTQGDVSAKMRSGSSPSITFRDGDDYASISPGYLSTEEYNPEDHDDRGSVTIQGRKITSEHTIWEVHATWSDWVTVHTAELNNDTLTLYEGLYDDEAGTRVETTSVLSSTDITFNGNSLKRLTPKLTQAFSTAIPANANLNTTAYLKVGQYNTSSSATAATQTNCPTQSAYNMTVENPNNARIDDETTQSYAYRVRTITDINGNIYVQKVNSGATAGSFTYGTWKQVAYTSDITDTNVTQTVTTTSAAYPLLFGATAVTLNSQATTKTEGARISGAITVNPSTGTINARRIHTGTTSQYGRFVLGNSIANGTAGCSHGEMYVYGKGDKYARIYDKDNVLTANREYYFPNQSGYFMVDAVTTGNLTATSNVNTADCKWTKVGKTVRISGTFYFSTSTSTGTLFTGLPAPASEMTIIVAGCDSYGSTVETLSINTSGEIEFNCVGTHFVDGNPRFVFDTTYISAS